MKRILNLNLQKRGNILKYGLGLGLYMAAFIAHAHDVAGYKGFQYGSKEDPYWLTVNGALKLDDRLFMGDKGNDLYSGASIREFGLDFSGGVGKDILMTLGTKFDAANSKVEVSDAYITYSGYKGLGENFHISIGKVNPSFCLETTSSSKWIPFLERSLASTAFQPDQGLGISANHWSDNHSINATVTQPKPGAELKDADGKSIQKSDRLQLNARGTLAHFFGQNRFLQVGLSGHIEDNAHTGLEFSTAPEAKARYSTTMLLNTTNPNVTTNSLIKANSHYVVGLELMGQDGPLSGEAEYQIAKVNRDNSQPGGNLKFDGYHAHINYVVTGEARKFKAANGTLGQVIPDKGSKYGAFEISGRYSFLNLNNKNVLGGSGHNIGAAATWYANYNIAVTLEYIKSRIYKRVTLEKLNIHTVAGRLQLVF